MLERTTTRAVRKEKKGVVKGTGDGGQAEVGSKAGAKPTFERAPVRPRRIPIVRGAECASVVRRSRTKRRALALLSPRRVAPSAITGSHRIGGFGKALVLGQWGRQIHNI